MFEDINDCLIGADHTEEEVDTFWSEWLNSTGSWPSSHSSIFIRPREEYAIHWLAHISRNEPEQMIELIRKWRDGHVLYEKFYRNKRGGGKRIILVPTRKLMEIQSNINLHVLKFLSIEDNVFGFSGGNSVDAIIPHLDSKSMLRADIKNAFPSISYSDIFFYFITGINKYGPKKMKEDGRGYFSWYLARALSQLVTWKGKLPQGAPTSPRMFDLVCAPIDIALSRLARNVGGVYTRYAGNIFFSMDAYEFPRKVRQAILKTIEGGPKISRKTGRGKGMRRLGPMFEWHKLKVGQTYGRMLGLNVRDAQLHNTRKFKRKLRKTIHHVKWLLEKGGDGVDLGLPMRKLLGLMSYAQKDTLPNMLIQEFEEVKNQIIF